MPSAAGLRLLGGVAACVTVLAGPAGAQAPAELSGSWILKLDVSNQADTVGSNQADTAGADSAPAALPSDLQPVLRRAGKPEEQQQLGRLIGMANPVAAFRITQTDTSVTFTNQDGFTYTVRPDRGRDSIVVGEEAIQVRARWRGRALEVEFRPPGGGRIIERYELADSRIFLRLEVVVEHGILAQRLWRPRMYRLEGSE